METSTYIGFYVMGGLMAASLLAGIFVFWIIKPEHRPAQRWIDHPSIVWRCCHRLVLFIACFLLPFAIVMCLLGALDRVDAFHSWSAGLSRLAALALLIVPTVLLWIGMYRGLLHECRGFASSKRES
jgi:hypothetical protein